MRSDAERFRFLADNDLTLHTNGDGYLVHWVKRGDLGQPPKFYPVSEGSSADEAVDRAIVRWERKHSRKYSSSS